MGTALSLAAGIGTMLLLGGAVVASRSARADEPAHFSAQVDRLQIGQEDTVSLKLNVQANGNASISQPGFEAPDFEVVNSYDSNYVESYYDQANNSFGMKNTQQLTKVLRPLRSGTLRISHIRVSINGKAQTAPDIQIQVAPPGAGTPAAPSSGGVGGGGVGLRGAGKYNTKSQIFVRAEVDKDKVYKGEQVIVSYYLYRRVRAMNLQVQQFPTLSGFLREELEMPVMQPRLDSEPVVLDGVPYQRSLLSRYAVYPLKEGKLKVDAMGLKYNYFAENGLTDDGEDPFLNFFKQLSPREGSAKSETVTVDVQPLPPESKPSSFSGGVGDFNISSAVDRYEVRANEPLTLTVKIEGKGNIAAIGEPKVKWPSQIEYYDSKATTHSGKGGVGNKVFEITLIPRKAGPATLPPLEFSFFDPAQKKYITRATTPIQLTVAEGAPGSPIAVNPKPAVGGGTPETAPLDLPRSEPRGLKAPGGPSAGWAFEFPFWRLLYILAATAFAALLALMGRDVLKMARGQARIRKQTEDKTAAKRFEKLRAQVRAAARVELPWAEVAAAYASLESLLYAELDRKYQIGARSLRREDLGRILTEEKGLDPGDWRQLREIFEQVEMSRFSGQSPDRARSELQRYVTIAETFVKKLG